MILKSFPNTSFLLIGEGPKRKTLSEKARQLGLKNNVIFLGYRNDVERLMQIIDIAVLLTNSDVILEGISNAIIEAMAMGIPVIASEGGGTNEIINNNVNGILVKPKKADETAKAIIGLLSDRKKAKGLSDNAKLFVHEKFNLQRYIRDYEKIYKELLFF
jgi:glycosyltransferase involved in cell wall biosynthesis